MVQHPDPARWEDVTPAGVQVSVEITCSHAARLLEWRMRCAQPPCEQRWKGADPPARKSGPVHGAGW